MILRAEARGRFISYKPKEGDSKNCDPAVYNSKLMRDNFSFLASTRNTIYLVSVLM